MIELYRKYTAAKGWCKKGTLEGNYKAFVLPEEVSDSKLVHEKLREVLNNGEAWKQSTKNLKRKSMSCTYAWHKKYMHTKPKGKTFKRNSQLFF